MPIDKIKKNNIFAHVLAVISVISNHYDALRPLAAIYNINKNIFTIDFELKDGGISEKDFSILEKDFETLKQKNMEISNVTMRVSEAKKVFSSNKYKRNVLEENFKNKSHVAISELNGTLELGSSGIKNTKKLGVIAFTNASGAYWKNDEKNKMLFRIECLVGKNKKDIDLYLEDIKKAESRDHRKLGRDLDLFTFSDLVGSGLPLYLPKGTLIRRLLQEYVIELQSKHGYQEVWTPQIAKSELFKISGHYDKYKSDMFKVVSNYSNEEFFLKPMNCPMHAQLYQHRLRSYKDLPLRYSDFANLYRDEKPGELSGLTRLRFFSQDDGHCFCRDDQLEKEFENVISMISQAMKTFGLKHWIRLSLWDPNNKEKYLGAKEDWKRSQKRLENILIKNKYKYKKVIGEAAIYGPKMDFMAVDALGREWQISTIQLDFIQPERFGISYTDKDGSIKTPILIHRAVLGSPERFMGLILENYSGNLPTWLMPTQVVILPISKDQRNYSDKLYKKLLEDGIRAETWDWEENLNIRIKKAELNKIPYTLIVGKREQESNVLSIRVRDGEKNQTEKFTIFIKKLEKEVRERILQSPYAKKS